MNSTRPAKKTANDEKPTLYIVHCIDTEGPLEETVAATFERLNKEKSILLEPSCALLKQLQNQEVDLNGREAEIADFLAPHRLSYLSRWSDIENMISVITSKEFRYKNSDMVGGPYTFSWFIIDVVGYKDNPRRKSTGYHAVWDQYTRFLKERQFNDAIGWHFHTVPIGNHALHYNTCWTNNDYHERVLSRRILEREWFPSVFRAGGHIERNDLSYWLEQFIPFDYSCHSLPSNAGQPGSLSDWRFAPLDWDGYHPDFKDYRQPGTMQRWLFRCLDINTNYCCLTAAEVESAFRQLRHGKDAILAFSSHDRRDIRPDIEATRKLIQEVAAGYPETVWKYANAIDAAIKTGGIEKTSVPVFSIDRKGDTFFIRSDQPLFNTQPFVAIQEEGDVFFRANPTIESKTSWAYSLVRPGKTISIGAAGSNNAGLTGVKVVAIR